MSDTTLATATHLSALAGQHDAAPPREYPVLTVIWWKDAPHRVGETLWINPYPNTTPMIFGRGHKGKSYNWPRLSLNRLEPIPDGQRFSTGRKPQSPLNSRKVSREQWRLESQADGRLAIQNIGRRDMVVNGNIMAAACLNVGDRVGIRDQILFYYHRRKHIPIQWPADTPVSRSEFGKKDDFAMVGEGDLAWALRRRIAFAAQQDCHVLVLGPTGAGKEHVAQAIHGRSPRGKYPLIHRNAAAIPHALMEAELYGNMRNYPNPGMAERPGLIGRAHQSHLFLDEIGELPHAQQASLLRVLDAGHYTRLGESSHRSSNFRLIAATNRAPENLKVDFLERFAVHIQVPGLNERKEDIPLIARELWMRMAADRQNPIHRFKIPGQSDFRVGSAVIDALFRVDYQQHVRQLRRLLIDCIAHSPGDEIEMGPLLHAASQNSEINAPAPAPPQPSDGKMETAPLLISPPGRSDFEDSLSPSDRFRMHQQRLGRFRPTECAKLPDYGFTRQTATKHRKVLLARAYKFSHWDAQLAPKLLLDGQKSGEPSPEERSTLLRLEKAMAQLLNGLDQLAHHKNAGPERWEKERQSLRKDYGSDADALIDVIQFLCKNKE